MNIIIFTGPKHSGKTSAGKAFASLCLSDNIQNEKPDCQALPDLSKSNFIDLDELITQKTGKTPRELFSEAPEIFKQAEADAIHTAAECASCAAKTAYSAEDSKLIIAAGGGIIDNPEALSVIKNAGALTVYLSISADTAWKRIYNSAAQTGFELPPFLRTENPQETHRLLHERRAAAYLQIADIVIEAEGKTPEQIAQSLCSVLTEKQRFA